MVCRGALGWALAVIGECRGRVCSPKGGMWLWQCAASMPQPLASPKGARRESTGVGPLWSSVGFCRCGLKSINPSKTPNTGLSMQLLAHQVACCGEAAVQAHVPNAAAVLRCDCVAAAQGPSQRSRHTQLLPAVAVTKRSSQSWSFVESWGPHRPAGSGWVKTAP
jgi:hypothetical protein